MRKNNKPVIIICIIFILVIAVAICAYLYMMTDVFRSNKELFSKYFLQNTETLGKVTDLQAVKTYNNLENESKYELNTDIKTIHSEGGEISNPLNNLSAKIGVQKNNDEQYLYANVNVLYEDEEYLNAELIKEQGQYGIRFSDVAKKFVTIQNDENIENIAKDIGIDVEELITIINIIDGNKKIVTEENKNVLKDKYSNIITTAILNGTFEKQKNAIITYNNVTTDTNAYSVSLSSEQFKDMLVEILNNAKNEQIIGNSETITNFFNEEINSLNEVTEFPGMKISVYEKKQQTIRTVFEIGIYKITIENTEQNGEIKTNINYLNSDQEIQYNVEINKINKENIEKFEIIVDCVGEEKNSKISFLNEMQILENTTVINTELSHKQDITTSSIILENEINVGNDFEKMESIASNNYVNLNLFEDETRIQFIEQLKRRIQEKMNERIKLLIEKILPEQETTENAENVENSELENEMPQVEINKFNAKFEFYSGAEVSAENVKALLNIIKSNIKEHEIISPEISTITIYIEKDKTNEESMIKIQEQIKDDEKYRVSIFYKESNGLIDKIVITKI